MNPIKQLAIIQEDPWLSPYQQEIKERLGNFKRALKEIEEAEGSLINFATAHQYYGIHFEDKKNGWTYREWAPDAYQLFLTGDFNGWDRSSHPLERNQHNDWEIFLPFEIYYPTFTHGSKIKVTIHGANAKECRQKALERARNTITSLYTNPPT